MRRIQATLRVITFLILTMTIPFLVSPPAMAESTPNLTLSSWFKSNNKHNTDQGPRHILRFAVHVSGMGNMDPHFAAASQDRSFADMVFNGLLRYRPGQAPAIEPDLATAMPILSMEGGHQVWTVNIRKGVLFHKGPLTEPYELTADDVVYSFNKAADEKRSAYAGDYKSIQVVKVDPYTVKFILLKPLSSTLFFPRITNYNGGFIVSKKAMEAMGDAAYRSHPVGTGPFMFQGHEPGKKVSLTAHDDYFKGKPGLKGVEMLFMPEIIERKAGLIEGELDVIIGSGKKGFAKDLLTYQGIRIDTHGVGEVTTLYMNTHVPPMDDIRVRKAVQCTLNKASYLNVYNKDYAGLVHSPVPAQFLPGGLTEKDVEMLGLKQKRDIQKAKALLAEAGYPNGFMLDLTASEKRIYRSNYHILREQLAAIGIVCNVKVLPHAEMHREIRKNPRPIVIYTAWRPNADVFLTRFFHSDAILVTGVQPDTNFSHYTRVDKLIEDARHEVDPQIQMRLWHQAQIRILSDVVAVPLIYAKMRTPRRDYVDYGHPVVSSMALYPQITENTKMHVSADAQRVAKVVAMP